MPPKLSKPRLSMPRVRLPRMALTRGRATRDLVGLDIQPGYIAAVEASVNGSVRVAHAAGMALDVDVVREGEVQDIAGLADALREVFQDSKLSRNVRIGLANQRTVLRILELPPIEDRKEMAAAVRFQAEDEVPMPLNTAVLDFQPLGLVDTPNGPRQRVALVAAQREMVDRLLESARLAGLRPLGVDLSAFAMIRSLYRPAPTPERLVYLAVGGLSNMAIADGPVCRFTRVLGGGLEAMAIEVASRREVPLEDARELLSRVGLDENEDPEAYHYDDHPTYGPTVVHPEATATGHEQAPVYEQAEGYEQAPEYEHAAGYQQASEYEHAGEYEQPPPGAGYAEEGDYQQAPVYEQVGGYEQGDGYEQAPVYEQVGGYEHPATGDFSGGPAPAAHPYEDASHEASAQPGGDAHGLGRPHADAAPEGQMAPAVAPAFPAPHSAAPANVRVGATRAAPTAEYHDVRAILLNGVREIAGEVRNSLDYSRAQEGGESVAAIVLSGPALEVPGFAEALERELGLPVRPSTVGAVNAGSYGLVSAQRLAVAAGLGIVEVPA